MMNVVVPSFLIGWIRALSLPYPNPFPLAPSHSPPKSFARTQILTQPRPCHNQRHPTGVIAVGSFLIKKGTPLEDLVNISMTSMVCAPGLVYPTKCACHVVCRARMGMYVGHGAG